MKKSNYCFKCSICELTTSPSSRALNCPDCNAPFDVNYISLEESKVEHNSIEIPLPINSDSLISLGEGNTPTIKLHNLSDKLEIELSTKLEYFNPTGSFKDRGSSIMISCLKQSGIKEISEDSSGNAGASISAYASKAQIKSHIFAPSSAPSAKINQIKVYGANTYLIGGSRDQATIEAKKFSENHGVTYASHNLSPYFIEGTKIFGYEIFRDLYDSGKFPEHIILPVGNGSLFLGALKSFHELFLDNKIHKIPKIHAVQTESIQPIYSTIFKTDWNPVNQTKTIAGGIAVATPPRLNQMVKAIQQNNGTCEIVSEKEIIEWQLALANQEGLYIEPTSAAAFASIKKLIKSKVIQKGESVLIPSTGIGLKDTSPI